MEFLTELTAVHWLVLGGGLLILELLGAGGYLLWLGTAALMISATLVLIPFGWISQWLGFSVLSLLLTGSWWRWQHQRLHHGGMDAASSLNQRPQQWIGQTAILVQDVSNGLSRVRLGDGVWPVRCSQPLPAGSQVIIRAAEGITLIAEPYPPPHTEV